MKLQHFSKDIITITEVHATPQKTEAVPYQKPHGLWVSDEDDEMSWTEWVTGEELNWNEGKFIHDVELADDANVLYLSTDAELREFSRKWSVDYHGMNAIPWNLIAREWHGVLITPYIWSCRLDMETDWYYGWDCASGCIWDPRAIKSITPQLKALTP